MGSPQRGGAGYVLSSTINDMLQRFQVVWARVNISVRLEEGKQGGLEAPPSTPKLFEAHAGISCGSISCSEDVIMLWQARTRLYIVAVSHQCLLTQRLRESLRTKGPPTPCLQRIRHLGRVVGNSNCMLRRWPSLSFAKRTFSFVIGIARTVEMNENILGA